MEGGDTIDRARKGDVEYFRGAPLRDIQTAVSEDFGKSSFSIAVLWNKLECCKMIYSRCPSLLYHCSRTNRNTAMHYAAYKERTQLIEFLIWANDQKDYVGEETDVESGLRRQQIKNFNLLTMPNSWGWVPLHHAVWNERVDAVKMLIEADHGRDSLKMLNETNETPLHMAVRKGNIEIVKALIEADHGRDSLKMVNREKETPLHLAVERGNYEIVKALFEANPDFEYGVDKSGDALLSLAIKAKSVKTREECEFPTDVLCKDKFLIQSVITNARTTEKDVTSAMFTQESGTLVQDCKLKVFSTHQDPSSVPERLNDSSSTRASVSDNNLKADEEPQEQSSEIMKNASLKRSSARSESIEKLMRELATDKPRQFSHEDLISFTSNLSTKLGSGAFGNVYKGQFLNGVEIAVKVLVENEVVEEEFKAEVSTMGRTYHRNLVKLYGFCFDDNMKAIVYEYASNGSLDHVLFENRFDLKWEKLYDIAVETAKALVYLHDGCYDKIIHHDIKPANVLLDLNFSPKITDFGLAKLMNRNVSHLTMTRIRGTAGYAAPETFMPLSEITYKCDVYSFGMMLFEILGRRRNVTSKSWFAKQVWKKFEKGQLDEIIEECGIIGENKEKARILSFIALWCIQHTPETRPSMSTVSTMLEKEIQVTTPPNPFLSSLPIYSMQPSQHS